MLHDIEEETRMKRILEILDKTLQIALKIDEVVGRLSEKRVTLEEKMIRSYFHQVQANLLEISAALNRGLASATTPKSEYDSARHPCNTEEIKAAAEGLDLFLGTLESAVDELLKVLRYDLNFVEQYFEFNYYGKLTNEYNFFPDSSALLDQIKSKIS